MGNDTEKSSEIAMKMIGAGYGVVKNVESDIHLHINSNNKKAVAEFLEVPEKTLKTFAKVNQRLHLGAGILTAALVLAGGLPWFSGSPVLALPNNNIFADSREYQPLPVLQGHKEEVWIAEFSPDGQTIVTASADGTARVWNLQSDELATLRGHEFLVWTAKFSPDGQAIVTASLDGTARVWNLQGDELATLQGHEREVVAAEFSPDGQTIVTASMDRTARVWNLQRAKW